MPSAVQEILQRAKEFKENNVVVDWRDYESFKAQLIDLGYYDYCSDLADALGL